MIEAISNGVILAEDDALVRAIVRSVLVSANQQVFPAVDGLEALHLARQFKARLVLLDIAMPRCNGLQACEAIRALPHYANVPIVMLTGHDEGPVRQAALRIGASDFITKPFRPDVLLTRLASFLIVPAELLHTDLGDDAILGGGHGRGRIPRIPDPRRATVRQWSERREIKRAVVWDRHKEDGPPPRDNAQLIEGREAIRIHRNAESKS